MFGFESCVLAELFYTYELMFLFLIMLLYLSKQIPSVSFALAGYSLYILRVYANAFCFHYMALIGANLQLFI